MAVTKNKSVIKSKIYSLKLILILGILVMLIKFTAFAITGSNAILSDALESFINIIASGFALYSVLFSAKLKDSDHPYGHGKMEFIAIGFEGALIFLTGIFIIIKSIINLVSKHEIKEIDTGIIIVAVSGILLFFMGNYLIVKAKKLNAPVLKADGKHLMIDSFTSAGLIVGLIFFKLTGYYWIDSVLAIILSLHIMFSGYKMIKQATDSLLDKADMKTIEEIATVLQNKRQDTWIDVHNLRLQKFGHYLHVDCHLTLPFYATLDDVHHEVKKFEKTLNNEFNNTIELFVHTDPCMQLPCNICNLKNCAFRKMTFEKELEWTQNNLVKNKKHRLP